RNGVAAHLQWGRLDHFWHLADRVAAPGIAGADLAHRHLRGDSRHYPAGVCLFRSDAARIRDGIPARLQAGNHWRAQSACIGTHATPGSPERLPAFTLRAGALSYLA